MPALGTSADPLVLGDSDDSERATGSFRQIVEIPGTPPRYSSPAPTSTANKEETTKDHRPTRTTANASPRNSIKSSPMKKITPSSSAKQELIAGNVSRCVSLRKVSELQDDLLHFKRDMEANHRETVRWLLDDARRVKSAPLKLDRSSPFAHMRSLQLETAAPGTPSLKVDLYFYAITKKKPSKTKCVFITKSILNDVPRVPKYSHHVAVKRNILSPDTAKLKYIPYTHANEESTKEHARLERELVAAYTINTFVSSRESERAAKFSTHLDSWLQRLFDKRLDRKSLERYLLEHDEGILDARIKDKQLLLNALGTSLNPNITESARKFFLAFENVFKVPLHEILFPDKYVKERAKLERRKLDEVAKRKLDGEKSKRNSNDLADIYGTYSNLTCLICSVVSCQTHGDYNPVTVNYGSADGGEDDQDRLQEIEDEHEPLSMNYDAILRKYRERHAHDAKSASHSCDPCSMHCHLSSSVDASRKWTSRELQEVRRLWITLRDPDEQACDIAFLLDLRCDEVYQLIQEFERGPTRALEPVKAQPKRSKRPEWYDNKRKTLVWNWMDLTEAHLHQERFQANPCSHEGPCNDNDCLCFKHNLLCETICACLDDCARRFTGCSCVYTGMSCSTDACICIQMNRECGPQCSSCGAISRLNPAVRHDDDLFATGCRNVPLQRGVDKRTLLGESQLEGTGYGLYAGEPILKGDYIGEYAGEASPLISFSEADRRGIIYDRRYLSFLFDLNSEWAVDGARLGNEMRFLNHADSEDYGLNCSAKIMLVNGEHRIKFSASRDIEIGEELLFNYGKKFVEKHGLSKKLPKAKDGPRGVLVGDEALKALDGLDSRREKARSVLRNEIAGESARGGRKARKTAPVRAERRRESPKVLEEEILPMEEIPDGGEEDDFVLDEATQNDEGSHESNDDDDDDEPIRDPRSRRKITRPARYTR